MQQDEHYQIPDDCLGKALTCVRVLTIDFPDEPGPPMRAGLRLELGDVPVVIQALTDTSELAVRTGGFEPDCESADRHLYSEQDVTHEMPFSRFVGKPLRNWWAMTNERGYSDGFTVAFETNGGLCFIAMNDEVSVLAVSGEQMA